MSATRMRRVLLPTLIAAALAAAPPARAQGSGSAVAPARPSLDSLRREMAIPSHDDVRGRIDSTGYALHPAQMAAAFERSGMVGLLDERPGRRGPVKLSPEVLGFLEARRRERPGASGAELAGELEAALGVRLHRRTVEKALGGLR